MVVLDTCWLMVNIKLLYAIFMLLKSSQFTLQKQYRDARTTLECNFGEIGKHIWGNVAFKLNGDGRHVVTLTSLFIHSLNAG